MTTSPEENKFNDLKQIVLDNLKENFRGETPGSLVEGSITNFPFKTLDEFQKITGRRFRMKKDQKDRGLTRDQAFQEYLNSKK